MSEMRILDTFASHAFLHGLSNHHLMTLASGVRPFQAKAGELLGRQGAAANAFYLIQAGHVEIKSRDSRGERRTVLTVGPGEIVGWSWLLPPHRWQFDCQAQDQVEGLAFDAEWLRDQCERNHELGYHLLKHLLAVVAGRLAASRVAAGEGGTLSVPWLNVPQQVSRSTRC
jgi:CRP/FNR family cyclic AMP-dependent transcriptional regulator